MDIFITTTNENDIPYIKKIFATYKQGNVNIAVIPNRGRNISAFLCYNHTEYKKYEYIGHIHTKKSADLTLKSSTSWRNFLFAHLIGGQQILESILFLFTQNQKLGLLFPEDPRLPGWSSTENKVIARQLMENIAPNYKLPQHIEFPVGAMFWSRYQAIAPLFKLKLQHEDFPQEPLAIDGTIAHAIERIFPCVCESSGFTWETLKIKNFEMRKLKRK